MWSLAAEQWDVQAEWRFEFCTDHKNKDYQTEIKCNFYEATIGSPMKAGLKTSCLPDEK